MKIINDLLKSKNMKKDLEKCSDLTRTKLIQKIRKLFSGILELKQNNMHLKGTVTFAVNPPDPYNPNISGNGKKTITV